MKRTIAFLCLIICPQILVGAASPTRSARMAALAPKFDTIIRNMSLQQGDLQPDELSFLYEYTTANATPEQKKALTLTIYELALASEDLQHIIRDIRFSQEDLKGFLKYIQDKEAHVNTKRDVSEDEKAQIAQQRKVIQLSVDKDKAGILYLSNEEKQARIDADKARAGVSSMSAADKEAKRQADLARARARRAGQ